MTPSCETIKLFCSGEMSVDAYVRATIIIEEQRQSPAGESEAELTLRFGSDHRMDEIQNPLHRWLRLS
jgi:hypothetical protein